MTRLIYSWQGKECKMIRVILFNVKEIQIGMRHIGTKTYETERLILRPFTEDDAEAVFHNWASDDEVTKYLTWPTHSSVEASRWYVNYCIQQYSTTSRYQWGIELKSTHELIGNISVVSSIDELECMELGWVIGRKYWGNGYMPEAATKVIDVLFDEVGANCVYAGHDVNNPKSGRVMQKIGMKFEGVLRQFGKNNQGIVDVARYSIVKSERGRKR